MSDDGIPEVGALAVDTAKRRTGHVMGRVGPYIQLRPVGGGTEWDACPENVKPVEADGQMHTRVDDANSVEERWS
ncbi:hypothetical protein QMK19_18545 [Streptomyces sp. H10-C2]|uniref:hypothetical protein n=1 Tax=unclassified Streptomyces TaxID=2593676 RepID=UPI0024B9BE6D|nr:MULTISPECIES: hypothetical protein [unclassified Streptomyces]MDJ0340787.1 hypothetical protein [Streptomyces sp. PH10-H1]MDJ0371627.1 hypothetical protein [Streptomyces sp. H10-C2]